MPMQVQTPETPGSYVLEVDVVCEGVIWFGEAGGQIASIAVSVTDGR